jgi:DNA ligase-1
MLLATLVDTSERVRKTRSRTQKVAILAATLTALSREELELGVGWLVGKPQQGKLGVGPAAVREASTATPAATASLELLEVDRRLAALAAEKGQGATGRRTAMLGSLMAAATADEQRFLAGLLLGELRQGALEGLMVEAIAEAMRVPAEVVRRAAMLSGSLPEVAGVAARAGEAGLRAIGLELFRPILPMLAQTADDVDEALERLGEANVEHKLDGARVQVHKDGERVEVYSRLLNQVTPAVPEIVELVRTLPARALVLDGEALTLRPDGGPQPFQVTMRRFGRRLDVERMRAELPLVVRFFDCLRLDAQTLLDEGTRERLSALDAAVPPAHRVPRRWVTGREEAEAFFDDALAHGHEGLMLKAADAPYQAGRRGRGWLKLKPAHTLDLVVLAVEPGSGRREGWLSNLHLGARDPHTGGFVMLGKTFKGLSDAMLAWQTEKLRSLEIGREALGAAGDDPLGRPKEPWVVHVRPELVVEIAFSDVQQSPQYPGGLALRFARVKSYREDKPASEADTIDRVREIFVAQGGTKVSAVGEA